MQNHNELLQLLQRCYKLSCNKFRKRKQFVKSLVLLFCIIFTWETMCFFISLYIPLLLLQLLHRRHRHGVSAVKEGEGYALPFPLPFPNFFRRQLCCLHRLPFPFRTELPVLHCAERHTAKGYIVLCVSFAEPERTRGA